MKVMRVYIDTSIVGGKFDPEFEKASLKFFNQVKHNRFHPIISALVREELVAAP